MDSVEYTIAVCNYNMGESLSQSITSLLEQTDDRFEILVVDDGSTDNSVNTLRILESKHPRLRLILLEQDDSRQLGQTRNVSVKNAKGDHVILHLDADDEFAEGAINDLTYVYEQISAELDKFVLSALGAIVASRDTLLKYGPYRNLPVGAEDIDCWRRLHADDLLIWVDSEDMAEQIGTGKTTREQLLRWYHVAIGNFQAGITFSSYLQWAYQTRSLLGFSYFCLMLPFAYLKSRLREQFTTPEPLNEMGYFDRCYDKGNAKLTLDELDEKYGVSIDVSNLSPAGQRLFNVKKSAD